jgi:hypothetical protein
LKVQPAQPAPGPVFTDTLACATTGFRPAAREFVLARSSARKKPRVVGHGFEVDD